MRIEEGKQYFVNRITFVGNTTTRDNVIRREMRLFEGGVFNTEALKYSVRRLNQLGYFKPLEGRGDRRPEDAGTPRNKVDVKLKFEEQNRNQITFGAGVSQYEGFFGQLAFQTSNFLGRGETFSVSAQQGNRAKNYQVGFTEPFLFDRPITAGVDVFDQEIQYIGAVHAGVDGHEHGLGVPRGPVLARSSSATATRTSRSRISIRCTRRPPRSATTRSWPTRCCSARAASGAISKIGPSYVYNTVDNPIFPTTGPRYSLTFDLAGLGGNTQLLQDEGRRHLVQDAEQPDVDRPAQRDRIHPPVRQHRRSCRSSRSCSSVASTASAASTSAASVRATRRPSWSSAATRACCSTPSI